MSSELVAPFLEALLAVALLLVVAIGVLFFSTLDSARSGLVVLSEFERGVVRRGGRVRRLLTSGIHWVTPFVDEVTRISTREIILSLPEFSVTSRAAPHVPVLAEVSFHVVDPTKAVLHASYVLATARSAKRQVRELCARARPGDLGAHIESTELRIRDQLDAETAAWGVHVTRVRLGTEAPERPRDGAPAEARKGA